MGNNGLVGDNRRYRSNKQTYKRTITKKNQIPPDLVVKSQHIDIAGVI
jgi:hypothetical protein